MSQIPIDMLTLHQHWETNDFGDTNSQLPILEQMF